MKTKDLCMLFAGLFLVGCSADEEIANVSTSESNAISFNVVSNNPQTKATIITSTSELQQYPFKVYAFRNGTAYGDADGIEIMYKDSKWDYVDPSKLLYWPHVDPVDFYAVSPVEEYPMHYSCNIQSNNQALTYYLASDEYAGENSSAYHGDHMDVMYAIAKGARKTDYSGVVKLQFKHALSQVVFKAKKNDPNIHVQIKGIRLWNVPSSGTFSFPSEENPLGSWDSSQARKVTYTVGMDQEPVIVNTSDVATNISENKPLLVIPCTLTKWDRQSRATANDQTNAFLQIECKIWKGSEDNVHYFVPQEGNGTAYGYTYVPFGATWEPGKRYVYTLVFGGGYTETGEEIDIVPITFEANVDEWETQSVDVTDSNPSSL